MKKNIALLSLIAIFAIGTVSAQTAPAKKAKAKTETKACCKEKKDCWKKRQKLKRNNNCINRLSKVPVKQDWDFFVLSFICSTFVLPKMIK